MQKSSILGCGHGKKAPQQHRERVTGVVSVKNPLRGCSSLCEASMKLDLLGKEDTMKFDFFADDESLLDEDTILECSRELKLC